MTAVMMDLSSEALAQGLHIKVKDFLSMGCDTHKLNDYIQSLETEQRKIEAFRRELPLCMQLITDVIRAVKEHQSQQVQCAASSSVLKLSCNSEDDDDQSPSNSGLTRKLETSADTTETKQRKCLDIDLEKPHWMAQAHLWSDSDQENTKEKKASSAAAVRPQAKHAVPGTFGLGGGAFSPFVRNTTAKELKANSEVLETATTNTAETAAATTTASPRPSERKQEQAEQRSEAQQPKSNSSSSGAGQRKSRRCWSPELHHRFVTALHQLGGAHVATPKQIREIMKVDGLTSDEVKSHLQKYRLHTRRPSVNPSATAAAAAAGCQPTQLVVLGGIWVPPEFAHQHNSSASSSPAAAGFVSPFTQEFYSRMSAAAAAAAAAAPTPVPPSTKTSGEPNQARSSEGESLEGGEQEGQSRHQDRDQEED